MGSVLVVFETITKIAEAIPVLDKWLRQFWFWYAATRIAGMKDEDKQAGIKMLADKDQREVEKLLGSSKAGAPSNLPGTELVDELPGVPKLNP